MPFDWQAEIAAPAVISTAAWVLPPTIHAIATAHCTYTGFFYAWLNLIDQYFLE